MLQLPPWPCVSTSWLISLKPGRHSSTTRQTAGLQPKPTGELQTSRPSPCQMEITYSCRGGGGGKEQKPSRAQEPGWNQEWTAEGQALTTFVLLDDIYHLPGLETQLRVLLLLIVGHHHVLFQDHGLGVGVGTWRGQKACGEPAAGRGPASGAPSVHRPRGRLLGCQRCTEEQPVARARSLLDPKDRPYSKAPHRPAAPRGPGDMGSRGTGEEKWVERGRGRQRWKTRKLREKPAAACEVSHSPAWGSLQRGLGPPLSPDSCAGWGVRGGPQEHSGRPMKAEARAQERERREAKGRPRRPAASTPACKPREKRQQGSPQEGEGENFSTA